MNKILTDNIILDEIESRQLLQKNNIAVNKYSFATNKKNAIEVALQMNFPLVMKVVSPQVVHKSDYGGVKVGISSVDEIEDAFASIYHNVCNNGVSESQIDGVIIQEMVHGLEEMLIGVKRDQTFGPVLVIGLGGVFVELMNDISLGICPLNEEEINNMLQRLKGYPLLTGYRGRKHADVSALVNLAFKVGKMVMEDERIIEMDLNPVILREKDMGVVAVDARIILKEN